MRTCSRCKTDKPLQEFAPTEYRCRECNREGSKEYREKHPERIKAAQERYNKTEKSKARAKRWRDNGGAEYQAEWQRNNRDRVAANARRSYYKNIESKRIRYTENNNRRRDLTRGFVLKKDLSRLMKQLCFVCGSNGEHVDHIIPLSRGGRHSIGNLQMLCASCNLSKGNKTMTEWKKYKILSGVEL